MASKTYPCCMRCVHGSFGLDVTERRSRLALLCNKLHSAKCYVTLIPTPRQDAVDSAFRSFEQACIPSEPTRGCGTPPCFDYLKPINLADDA